MCHLGVPERLKDKRCDVAANRELMKEQSHDSKHEKNQPCVCSGHTLAANVMTHDGTTADNLKIYTKKYLNEFNSVEKIR